MQSTTSIATSFDAGWSLKNRGRRGTVQAPETDLAVLGGGGEETAQRVACSVCNPVLVPAQKPWWAKPVFADIDDIGLVLVDDYEPLSISWIRIGIGSPRSGIILCDLEIQRSEAFGGAVETQGIDDELVILKPYEQHPPSLQVI